MVFTSVSAFNVSVNSFNRVACCSVTAFDKFVNVLFVSVVCVNFVIRLNFDNTKIYRVF